MRGDQRIDRLPIEHREYLNITFGIFVADVQPELVELVRRRITRIEPYVPGLGFAEFRSIRLLDQRAGQPERFAACFAADQLGSGGNISPLVGTAHLQFAVLMLIKMQKIGSLHQLVRKFGERHAVALAAEALLDRVFGHHVVDRNAFADVANKFQEREILHPVVVVDQFGRIRSVGLEVDQVTELPSDPLLVATQGLLVEQVALKRLARRVADHAGSPAHQENGLMPAPLEVFKDHNADKVPDMQRVRRRVDSDVSRRHLLVQLLLGSRHDIVHHAPPFEFLYKIHRFYVLLADF